MVGNSKPVPDTYKRASKILQNVKENGSTLEKEFPLINKHRLRNIHPLV